MEGVHDNEHNQVTWHTGPGCNLTPNDNFTGTVVVSCFRFKDRISIECFVRELSTVMAPSVAIPDAASQNGVVHRMVHTLTPREGVSTP